MTRIPGAALFLLVFAALLRRVCPTVFHDDSPETVIACLTLGVTHPPGDPPLTLLGRLWLLLPVGAPALRVNLLAATAYAVAVTVLWRAVSRTARPAGAALAAASIAGLLLACPEIAHQAAVAKGASYGLSLLLLTATAVAAWRGALPAAALFAGVLLAHHWMTAAAYGGILVGAGLVARRVRMTVRTTALALAVALLGLSTLLATPIRSAARPAYDAGGARTAGRLAAHLFRSSFAAEEAARPLADRLAQPVPVLAALARLAGPGGIFLALAAIAVLLRSGALPPLPLAAALAGPPLLAGGYLALPPERHMLYDTFLLPTWWTLVAMSAGWIAHAAAPRRLAGALAAAALAQIVLQSGAVADRTPARATWGADLARAQLSPLPRRAVVLTVSDLDTFPLWHAGIADAFRPDVTVVNWPWLRHRWYREQAGAALGLPALAGAADGAAVTALIAADRTRRLFTVPIPLAGLPPGSRPVPFHLLVEWTREARPARMPRGWPARGFHEAARRGRDWRADLATGYTAETMHRLMQAGATGRL